ncbi:MAG TPA: hypothetical protein VJR27_02905 [Candidatus Saccharimonadales bacterium]|nr:hypothetical protein [Candidatus Saccharimonadales bacterium]
MQNTPIYVFDLDGVITNPADSLVEKAVVEHVYHLLEKGIFVAVNTGRSYQWVHTNLLQALEHMGTTEVFKRVFIVCEKGGESAIWHGSGFIPQPSRFALSAEARELGRRIFETNKALFSTMFWDATKQTMATLEKRPSADLASFKAEQLILVSKLEQAFAGWSVKIDATTIATDIERREAGKHAGAALIYEWVRQHTSNGRAGFVSFGDSLSDYEMARYFAQKGSPSTFVFVGVEKVSFAKEPNVTVIRTKAHYAAGAREYLAKGTRQPKPSS